MRRAAIIEAPGPTAWRDPVQVLGFFADEPWALGLLSGGGGPRARWSYFARRPDRTLIIAPENPADPFDALRALLGPVDETDPSQPSDDTPPFQGGIAGLCAYELGGRIERLALGRMDGWPDLAFARYPAILAFDHHDRRILAVGRGEDASSARAQALQALAWLHEAGGALRRAGGPLAHPPAASPAAAYEAAVAEVVTRIERGEIFQANIARAWRGRLANGARPFELAARLADTSPAPFATYLRLPAKAVVSNSPERFISVTRSAAGLRAEAEPIKGTRPRGTGAAADARHAAELSASAKDRAENLMIVDLMRNDLSRVCEPGSVRAPALFRLESFANVHHLVSTVTGTLALGRDAIDLLRASLPPGSITGAPKVQAMKVISGHEAPRGPFFGAMVWIGMDGAMDSSVLIRTTAFSEALDGWVFEARAGAGIVAESLPESERRETEIKIAAILNALSAGA